MTPKEARVWTYLIKNRKASNEQVAEACDVSEEFVESMVGKIGSPNWREEVSAPLTEGVKFDTDKPRMDLIPPEAMVALAQVLTFGAAKYSARNWELGMDWGRPYAAMLRHLMAWWGGEDKDPETGMSHMWHALCCAAFLVSFEERGIGKDDRPNTKAGASRTEGSD